jgi:hypothetical protein
MNTSEARYTSEQAAEALTMSYRRLDDILRRLKIEPSRPAKGTGTGRRWSVADIVAIAVGLEWANRGVPWVAIKKLLLFIQRSGLAGVDKFPVAMLSGDRVWAAKPGAQLRIGGRGPVMACDLRRGLATIKQRLAAIDARKAAEAEQPACEPAGGT